MRNVIVTGGTRGLGLGMARSLALSGFQVIAVARRESDAFLSTQEEIVRDGNGTLHFRPFDLENIEAIPGLVKAVRGDFGALYGLVNNAGLGTAGVLTNMPVSAIERLTRLNLVSPITLTKFVARSMMTGRGGRIVNISSIVATAGYHGLSVYSATKAALLGFTRSLARELGPLDITVNAVAPGYIDTELTHELTGDAKDRIARRSALKRMPEIQDVAGTVAFLFSDQARNITGTTITVDAGNTA
jgi:3-oxoacyl-[acyl-carrier protein] reductase